jgi:hypothetical protein
MTARVERDPAFARHIQQTWLRLFRPPPRPPIFSEEQWAKMMADAWNATLARAKANVDLITARGGRVIFVNHPSSGEVIEIERKLTPRPLFWDRILKETGAPGVHFDDHPELRDFRCPEWSHLSASDSVEYTRRLAAILKRDGLI